MCTKKVYKCFVFFSVGNYACVLLDGGGMTSVNARFQSQLHVFSPLGPVLCNS